MKGFSDITKKELKYYVYALVDPRNDSVFYVGKGTGDRVFQHEIEALNNVKSDKQQQIRDIIASGHEVEKVIVLHGLTEEEAFVAEAALINLLNFILPETLTNIVSGHHSGAVMTVEAIEQCYGAEELTEKDIYHNLLVVKINSLYRHGMSPCEIMDCARGHWVLNLENVKKVDYLVAVYHGLVVGVYENLRWFPSNKMTEFYPRPSEENLQLSKRKYCTCTPVNRSKYLNKSIKAVVADTQNPISYIWGRKNAIEILKAYYEFFSNESERNAVLFEELFHGDMEKMGYEMDGFTRYRALGKSEETLLSCDAKTLYCEFQKMDYLTTTATMYSLWRYITHWAYMDYCRYEEHTESFKAAIKRIIELCK